MVKGFLKDDILIINSDGLTNLVPQEVIFNEAKKNIEQAPKELVQKANENGGYDNITVIVIKNI
jgi:protein phosphatase